MQLTTDYVTPLCQAVLSRQTDVVERLIKHECNVSGKEGVCEDPLSYPALPVSHVFEALLQWLTSSDVRVGSVKGRDNGTGIVYNCGVVNMSTECGVDIHARNVDNIQAIDIASCCGRADIVRFLRDLLTCPFRYDNISASCLSSGSHAGFISNTAVHLTTYVHCIRLLLENGADIEVENADGLRPIHWAVRTGSVELVELLIQHGANVDAADVFGNRPLHEAACHGLSVVK